MSKPFGISLAQNYTLKPICLTFNGKEKYCEPSLQCNDQTQGYKYKYKQGIAIVILRSSVNLDQKGQDNNRLDIWCFDL